MDTNSILLISALAASGIALVVCIGFVAFLIKKIAALQKQFADQGLLVSKNKESIGNNKERIEANKLKIETNIKNIGANAGAIAKLQKQLVELAAIQAKALENFELFQKVLKEQMFIHESKLLSDHGVWCLEHEGDKKFFTPGRLDRVISCKSQEESVFAYDTEAGTVKCTVSGQEGVRSEIVYSLAGAPKSGKIYKNGSVVKEFTYNELGQVIQGV